MLFKENQFSLVCDFISKLPHVCVILWYIRRLYCLIQRLGLEKLWPRNQRVLSLIPSCVLLRTGDPVLGRTNCSYLVLVSTGVLIGISVGLCVPRQQSQQIDRPCKLNVSTHDNRPYLCSGRGNYGDSHFWWPNLSLSDCKYEFL